MNQNNLLGAGRHVNLTEETCENHSVPVNIAVRLVCNINILLKETVLEIPK